MKLLILREEAIENYKSYKKLCIDVETSLEVKGECVIISTLKVKENKKTEERKMKGMLSTLVETKKKNSGEQKQVDIKDGGYRCKFFCL